MYSIFIVLMMYCKTTEVDTGKVKTGLVVWVALSGTKKFTLISLNG